jgi:hypothetical protein
MTKSCPLAAPPTYNRVGIGRVGEDGVGVVVRGAGCKERVRWAVVGVGAGSTCGAKKGTGLGRVGRGIARGTPAVPTATVVGTGRVVNGGGGWEGGIGMG